jgi:1,4-alpha-glucan branching enzyme
MLSKRYISKGTICKVSFYLPDEIEARSAYVVGDFNSWDKEATPMEQLADGRWKAVLNLEAGREYQYRYLVNGSQWYNDWDADKYIAHPYGGENSVVVT